MSDPSDPKNIINIALIDLERVRIKCNLKEELLFRNIFEAAETIRLLRS